MDLKIINWNEDYDKFINYLIEIKDNKYQEFNKKIINTKYDMLGIKIPVLRRIAKEIYNGDYKTFLNILDNRYYELVMIRGLVISYIKDIDLFNSYFNDYLDLIDNWAICDTFCSSLKIVNNNIDYFIKVIDKLIDTDKEYRVRLALVLLLDYYVLEEYLDYIFKRVDNIKSDLYYINMAKAWLLCECFIKYPNNTMNYFKNNNLDKFTINKTISKIRDSYRVDASTKEYLLSFRK